jgi:ribosome-binding factor A
MQESKRQKQVAAIIQEALNTIFHQLSLTMVRGTMVSISKVVCTPDLLEARIYISLFQGGEKEAVLKKIEDRAWEIKKLLSEDMKNQLRRIPVLKFYLDDTLEHVFRMEELFKQIEEDRKKAAE